MYQIMKIINFGLKKPTVKPNSSISGQSKALDFAELE